MRRITTVGLLLAALVLGAAARATTYNVSDENKIEQMTNATRAGVGVKPLAHMDGLQGMARAQAVRMAQRGDIYHNPNLSSDITALGVNWRMVGENVGMGPDASTVYAALLKSPHHYENIVRSNYNYFGIGEVNGPGDRIYLVQVFAEIVPAAAPAPVHVAPLHHTAPAPVRTVAPAPVHAAPKPAVKVARRPDPNALFGGLVFRAEAVRPAHGRQFAGLFQRLAHDVSSWA
jgi:hypothetical protein